jgi:hypothetical protein
MTESWANWEGEVVNDTFALRRYLGGSPHSVVYLTDHATHGVPAAIKFIPAVADTAELQLSNWRAAAALSDPQLLRLFHAGRYTRQGESYLFVVMEQAEETLSEILPHRPLTTHEARAMLPPVLDGLIYLHGRNLVQGALRPSNVLVVHDQIKLAADTVRMSGEAPANPHAPDRYDAPEARKGQINRAGDIWALGVTIVEALTHRSSELSGGRAGVASLPKDLPADFVSLVARCLNPNPSIRPSAQQLKAWITGESSAAELPNVQPAAAVVAETPAAAPKRPPARAAEAAAPPPPPLPSPPPVAKAPPASDYRPSPEVISAPPRAVDLTVYPRRSILARVLGAIAVLVLLWAGLHLLHRPPLHDSGQATSTAPPAPAAVEPAPSPAPAPIASSPTAPPPATPAAAPATAAVGSPGVLHEELPAASRSASDTIRGRFHIIVRVTVNRAGNVVDESLEDPGPSQYFARRASDAARQWRFTADSQDARQWLVRFDFSRDETTAQAQPAPAP